MLILLTDLAEGAQYSYGSAIIDVIRKLSIMRNCVLSRLENLVLKAIESYSYQQRLKRV